MASVNLNNNMRYQISRYMNHAIAIVRRHSIAEEGRVYTDEQVATELIEKYCPPAILRARDAMERMRTEDKQSYDFIKQHITMLSYVRLSGAHTEGSSYRLIGSMRVNVPQDMSIPGVGRYTNYAQVDVLPEDELRLSLICQEFTNDQRIQRVLEGAVSEFLDVRRTVGQVRRDWPEFIDVLPPDIQSKLGNTVARGPRNYDNLPARWLRERIIDMVAEAELLPNPPEITRYIND